MSLAPKNEQGYLEVVETPDGLAVIGQKKHTGELAPLYVQRGVRVRVEPDVRPGEDALRFAWGEGKAQIEQILESYKNAKGS